MRVKFQKVIKLIIVASEMFFLFAYIFIFANLLPYSLLLFLLLPFIFRYSAKLIGKKRDFEKVRKELDDILNEGDMVPQYRIIKKFYMGIFMVLLFGSLLGAGMILRSKNTILLIPSYIETIITGRFNFNISQSQIDFIKSSNFLGGISWTFSAIIGIVIITINFFEFNKLSEKNDSYEYKNDEIIRMIINTKQSLQDQNNL